MAFLDDLSRKLTMVGQEAANQTKAFAESARINSRISDEQNAINGYYTELGKRYFEANKDNPNAENLDLINSIKGALLRIDGYNEEVRRARGVCSCPQCGADVSISSMFCNYCGAKIPQTSALPNTRRCPQCGAELTEGSSFCTQCGTFCSNTASGAIGVSGGVEGLGNPIMQGGAYSTPVSETSAAAPAPTPAPAAAPEQLPNSVPTGVPTAIPVPIIDDEPSNPTGKISLDKHDI